MNQDARLGYKEATFKLADSETAKKISGVHNLINPVRIVEDGDVRTVIEAAFTYDLSTAIVRYTFNKKDSTIGLKYKVMFNQLSKCLKLEIPDTLMGKLVGKQVFGREELAENGSEFIYHDLVGSFTEDDGSYIITNGTYGGSYDNDNIYVSLLRTPAYTGHPINDRPVLRQDRYTDRMDIGYNEFSLVYSVGNINEAEIVSNVVENEMMSLNFFPNGGVNEKADSFVNLNNNAIELVSLHQKDSKFIIRLYNGSDKEEKGFVDIHSLGIKQDISLKPFVFESYEISNNKLIKL